MSVTERADIAVKPADFEPFLVAWDRLATAHPELGISPGKFSGSRFCSRTYERMAEVGAMRRTLSGRYLANRERFELAAFAILTCQDVHAVIHAQAIA